MDVAFLFSNDELFTMISLMPSHTEAGQRFFESALGSAEMCDLSGLVDKKLARFVGNEIALEPAVRMVADAIARADSAEYNENVWVIHSPWVSLQCENYTYREGYWKVTPFEEATQL
jgi:hypothetical protein